MTETHVCYSDLVDISTWGDDKVLLENDINLLKNTSFNSKGYGIVSLDDDNINSFLKTYISKRIRDTISFDVDIENYHHIVNEEQHKQVINSMPYKKNDSFELGKFCEYLETIISHELKEEVKIFNDDIWVRICRPKAFGKQDFNPCHRDVYLDFYRNTANIYLPIVGSNEKSSLLVQEGSHLWNENITAVTNGGAFFKKNNKKYSVDAIVQSKIELNMIRPNPSINELMLFSPYLIHGCSDNNNENVTRMSLEIRFIKKDDNGLKQEDDINEFLKKRVWR
jgi:hypothetical protein